MKVYSKELNSLQALQAEKRRIKRKLSAEFQGDFFSVQFAKSSKEASGRSGALLDLVDEFLPANSTSQIVWTLAKPLVSRIGEQGAHSIQSSVRKKGRIEGFFWSVAREIALGYLIGKTVQLSYRGIKSKVDRSKKA
ncbi:MAG: hypothetical protein JST36_09115 [Bacteroidetes bacterium]|nr:hypothetical protein [Bacteroidota bacterium]